MSTMTLRRGPRPAPPRRRPVRPVALALGVVAVLSVSAACSDTTDDGALPDTTLVSLADGAEVTTGSLAPDGTPLVVNVWASWCVPCIEEMPAFDEVHRELGEGVQIVGVTDDKQESAERLAAETGVTYPLYRDPDRSLLPELGVVQLPATLFVAADGTIVDRHQGAMTADELRGTIERLWGDQ